jgi:hypothetical protein
MRRFWRLLNMGRRERVNYSIKQTPWGVRVTKHIDNCNIPLSDFLPRVSQDKQDIDAVIKSLERSGVISRIEEDDNR